MAKTGPRQVAMLEPMDLRVCLAIQHAEGPIQWHRHPIDDGPSLNKAQVHLDDLAHGQPELVWVSCGLKLNEMVI